MSKIWSFTSAGQKTTEGEGGEDHGIGGVWSWFAIDAESGMILSYMVGGCGGEYALELSKDLALRLAGRAEVAASGGVSIEFAEDQLQDPRGSASYDERGYLSIRGGCSSHLSSMKASIHAEALALHVMHHNFVRESDAHSVTPAMAVSVIDRPWEVVDIVRLIESEEFKATKKGGL